MGDWTGSDDVGSGRTIQRALGKGVNLIDTALSYGNGKSERLVAQALGANAGRPLVATKIPPLAGRSARLEDPIEDFFPPWHINRSVRRSLENLGAESIDLIQFHTWNDAWAHDDSWQSTIGLLKDVGSVRGVGVSVNRGEPDSCLETLQTGLIDTVQVVYNILDQSARDVLFPLCLSLNVGVLVRVPLDAGSLTGAFAPNQSWPAADWRSTYFTPARLWATLERVEAIRDALKPSGIGMVEAALRFVISEPVVSSVIAGMRSREHLQANVDAVQMGQLPAALLADLRRCRWDRPPQ
jgi:aryl-alcohol dehydrogenase-like predicted oxidoreductase